MANEEHLKILKQGVKVWNQWREECPDVTPHLWLANLREADLRGANLSGADLIAAIFTGADLIAANFGGADLSKAKLADATLAETLFGNTNLSGTKYLESCVHYGPSIIDHQTLAKSGKLPLKFLRGCGLPDTFIDNPPGINWVAVTPPDGG